MTDREYLKWIIEDLYINISTSAMELKTHLGEMLELVNDKTKMLHLNIDSEDKITFGPVFGYYKFILTFNNDGIVDVVKEERSRVLCRSTQILNDIDEFLASIEETCGEVIYSNTLRAYDSRINEIKNAIRNTTIPSIRIYSDYLDLKREIQKTTGKTKTSILTDFLREKGIKIDDKLIQELARIADEERIKDGYE